MLRENLVAINPTLRLKALAVLLDEIMATAIDDKQPLPVLLRKRLLLAHELKDNRLKVWANLELNGYPSAQGIPEYRIVDAGANGNLGHTMPELDKRTD